MSPFDCVDRAFVINLEHRTDRRHEMERELHRIGVAPDSERLVWFNGIRPETAGPFPSRGARGCFMSHLGVLRAACHAGVRRMLIFEDDVDFCVDFVARFPYLIEALDQQDWSFFYGSYRIDEPIDLGRSEGLRSVDATLGIGLLQFVAVQGQAISELVAYLEAMLERPAGHPSGGPMHVDGAYSWFRREHPHRRTFIAVPALGHERSSRSDIHELSWFDRAVFVRSLAQYWRQERWRRSLRMRTN